MPSADRGTTDAGEVPIGAAARSAKERAAADRPVGLPPVARAAALRGLRAEFGPGEGAGGGSWSDGDVTLAPVDARLAPRVARRVAAPHREPPGLRRRAVPERRGTAAAKRYTAAYGLFGRGGIG